MATGRAAPLMRGIGAAGSAIAGSDTCRSHNRPHPPLPAQRQPLFRRPRRAARHHHGFLLPAPRLLLPEPARTGRRTPELRAMRRADHAGIREKRVKELAEARQGPHQQAGCLDRCEEGPAMVVPGRHVVHARRLYRHRRDRRIAPARRQGRRPPEDLERAGRMNVHTQKSLIAARSGRSKSPSTSPTPCAALRRAASLSSRIRIRCSAARWTTRSRKHWRARSCS